jgi:hypothetical protein
VGVKTGKDTCVTSQETVLFIATAVRVPNIITREMSKRNKSQNMYDADKLMFI